MGGRLAGLLDCRLHGQQHVGSGVTIGDRKHIKRVNCLVIVFQPGQAAVQYPGELLSIAFKPRLAAVKGGYLNGSGKTHASSWLCWFPPAGCGKRSPWTCTLTARRGLPSARSTLKTTLCITSSATVEIRVPYCKMTYKSIVTSAPAQCTSTPRLRCSICSISASPFTRCG